MRVSLTASSTTGDWDQPHFWLFSGDADRFLFAFNFDGPVNSSVARAWFWSIEREVNALGQRMAGGAYLSGYSTRDGDRQEYFSNVIGGVGIETEFGILAPRVGIGLSGTDVAVFPQYLSHSTFKPAGLNQLGYFVGALSDHTPVTIPVYGADHEYYPLGGKFGGAGTTSSLCKGGFTNSGAGVTLLARYDP